MPAVVVTGLPEWNSSNKIWWITVVKMFVSDDEGWTHKKTLKKIVAKFFLLLFFCKNRHLVTFFAFLFLLKNWLTWSCQSGWPVKTNPQSFDFSTTQRRASARTPTAATTTTTSPTTASTTTEVQSFATQKLARASAQTQPCKDLPQTGRRDAKRRHNFSAVPDERFRDFD